MRVGISLPVRELQNDIGAIKAFAQALAGNISKYEEKNGEIKSISTGQQDKQIGFQ